MLSYQHAYHAGGPADVHKHTALCAVLARLAEKEKPFVVIDLYAGHGIYDVTKPEAQKTREFEGGIGRLWPRQPPNVPPAVQKLFSAVADLNPDGRLVRYPGSPALARQAMRDNDQLILNELHPTAFREVRLWALDDARIGAHKRDGLQALVALTPPQIRRGLVVIDPSYEIKSEYTEIPETLRRAFQKWKEGIFFVWYPILSDGRHRPLIDGIRANIDAEILACELMLDPPAAGRETPGLLGTGIAIVNPPWQFDQTMREAGDWLVKHLAPRGRHIVRSIKSPGV